MIYHALSAKHKKQYVMNQLVVLVALVVALIVSGQLADVQLPTSVDKLAASAGFVTSGAVLLLAILNRVGALFKVRSAGFLLFFLLFATIKTVLDVLMGTTGLMFIVLLLDDVIMKSYWSSIWGNEYHDIAMRTQVANHE